MQDGGRRRARLILIVGVLFALGAGGGTFFIAQGSQNQAPPPIPTTYVVVAAREIPAKTSLTAADTKVAKMNSDVVPPAALTVKDPNDPKEQKELIGKITVVAVAIGEPILPNKYAAPGVPAFTVFPPDQLGANGAPNPGSPNYRAMSITVPDPNAAGGAILPGDVVDILFTLQFDPTRFLAKPDPTKQATDFSVKIVLERVPILAKTAAVYTIRVDAATAERLAYIGATGGPIQLLLRAPKDDRPSQVTGETFEKVLGEFKFQIPQKVATP